MPASAPRRPSDPSTLRPAPLGLADLGGALRFGITQFRTIPLLSMAFALLFVVIGTLLFGILEFGAIAPMSLSLAGGFMLVGPVLLAGFFAVSPTSCARAASRASATSGAVFGRCRGAAGWCPSFAACCS
jgi:hypothetical protein